MEWSEKVTGILEALLDFAIDKQLIEAVDRLYYRNLLLDAMHMDAPAENVAWDQEIPATATKYLVALCDLAVEKGLIEDMGYARDLFSARVMGLLTPSPKEVREAFCQSLAQGHAEEATQRFYDMCRACDYIKVDAIAQNVRYFADSPAGELEITITSPSLRRIPRKLPSSRMRPASAIQSACCAWKIPVMQAAAIFLPVRIIALCP